MKLILLVLQTVHDDPTDSALAQDNFLVGEFVPVNRNLCDSHLTHILYQQQVGLLSLIRVHRIRLECRGQ
jgi:hypothetical protein